jgi:hypothetical protein
MVLVPKIREHTVDYMASILSRGGGGGGGAGGFQKFFVQKSFVAKAVR